MAGWIRLDVRRGTGARRERRRATHVGTHQPRYLLPADLPVVPGDHLAAAVAGAAGLSTCAYPGPRSTSRSRSPAPCRQPRRPPSWPACTRRPSRGWGHGCGCRTGCQRRPRRDADPRPRRCCRRRRAPRVAFGDHPAQLGGVHEPATEPRDHGPGRQVVCREQTVPRSPTAGPRPPDATSTRPAGHAYPEYAGTASAAADRCPRERDSSAIPTPATARIAPTRRATRTRVRRPARRCPATRRVRWQR